MDKVGFDGLAVPITKTGKYDYPDQDKLFGNPRRSLKDKILRRLRATSK